VLDNPFMAHMHQRLPELKAERKWADDNPTYLREWCGKWVRDNSALFYRFDPTRNLHDIPHARLVGPEWLHVVGWDLGRNKNMALVAWAFHENQSEAFEFDSWKRGEGSPDPKKSETDLVMDQVRAWEKLGAKFIGYVADTGGLGGLVTDEVAKRPGGIPFEAAKKTEKNAHVELLNDDLLCGRVKLRRGSPYAQEIAVLPKDPESPEDKPPIEDPRFPNHCCDAGLYGWRKALHWLAQPLRVEPKPGTTEWQAAQAEAMRQQAMTDLQQRQEMQWQQTEW
jgi:hypothetical protein